MSNVVRMLLLLDASAVFDCRMADYDRRSQAKVVDPRDWCPVRQWGPWELIRDTNADAPPVRRDANSEAYPNATPTPKTCVVPTRRRPRRRSAADRQRLLPPAARSALWTPLASSSSCGRAPIRSTSRARRLSAGQWITFAVRGRLYLQRFLAGGAISGLCDDTAVRSDSLPHTLAPFRALRSKNGEPPEPHIPMRQGLNTAQLAATPRAVRLYAECPIRC